MFPKRPKPEDDEFELLKMMKDFGGEKSDNNILNSRRIVEESLLNKQETSADTFANTVLKSRIIEKNINFPFILDARKKVVTSNRGFPKILKLEDEHIAPALANDSKKNGSSMFAQQWARTNPTFRSSVLKETKKKTGTNFPLKSLIVDGSGLGGNADCLSIHEKNIEILSGMTEQEILNEREKLFSTADPSVLAFLRSKKPKMSPEPAPLHEVRDKNFDFSVKDEGCLEASKIAWIGDLPPVKLTTNSSSARFDFNGFLLPFDSLINVKFGLHHHGDEPERAGYSLEELMILCRSSFPQQNVIALEILTKILVNAHRGLFDEAFNENIVGSLLDAGIVIIARIGMDSSNSGILTASIACLAACICNNVDEILLDRCFHQNGGIVQPMMAPVWFIDHVEGSKTGGDMTDFEIMNKDIVWALIRMNILDRIAYILDVLKPDLVVIKVCLEILVRLSRHSDTVAELIIDHPSLLTVCAQNYLPIRWVAGINSALQSMVLKLLRILSSFGPSYCQRIVKRFSVSKIIFCFASGFDNGSSGYDGCIQLTMEVYRWWTIILFYDEIKVAEEMLIDFYPILMRQISFIQFNIDVDGPHHEMACTILCLIEVASLKKSFISPPLLTSMLRPIEFCCIKWMQQLKPDSRPSRALASTFRCLAALLTRTSDKSTNNRLINCLVSFIGSDWLGRVADDCLKHSALLSSQKNGNMREVANLPFLNSFMYVSCELVPCIQDESSPFNFLSSFFILVDVLRLDSLGYLINRLASRNGYFRKISLKDESTFNITSNWFCKFELEFLFIAIKVLFGGIKVTQHAAMIHRLTRTVITFVKNSDETWIGDFLLHFILFETSYMPFPLISCLLPSLYQTYYACLFGINSVKQSSAVAPCLPSWLVPRDWIYCPLLQINHDNVSRPSTSKDVQDVLAGLNWILICLKQDTLDLKHRPQWKTESASFVYSRLASFFISTPDAFLNASVGELLHQCIEIGVMSKKQDFENLSLDLYRQLIGQFCSTSYGNSVFALFILLPSHTFPLELWHNNDDPASILSLIRTEMNEMSSCASNFFTPPVNGLYDTDLIDAYLRAILCDWITPKRNYFLYSVAQSHLRQYVDIELPNKMVSHQSRVRHQMKLRNIL